MAILHLAVGLVTVISSLITDLWHCLVPKLVQTRLDLRVWLLFHILRKLASEVLILWLELSLLLHGCVTIELEWHCVLDGVLIDKLGLHGHGWSIQRSIHGSTHGSSHGTAHGSTQGPINDRSLRVVEMAHEILLLWWHAIWILRLTMMVDLPNR